MILREFTSFAISMDIYNDLSEYHQCLSVREGLGP